MHLGRTIWKLYWYFKRSSVWCVRWMLPGTWRVSKPSVCYAVGTLREGGFLTTDEKHYLHLTERGLDVAEKIYERHCFLTKHLISIGVDPETAEADACRIEHDISAETYERLKELVTKE